MRSLKSLTQTLRKVRNKARYIVFIQAIILSLWMNVSTAEQAPESAFDGLTRTEAVVMAFVKAFNRHDVNDMLALATDDVVWMSIDGEQIIKETGDAASLKTGMEAYFLSRPTSHSRIKQIQSSGNWVMTLEHAGRMVDEIFTGQCAYAMYKFDEQLIKSVWYFPAHNCQGD